MGNTIQSKQTMDFALREMYEKWVKELESCAETQYLLNEDYFSNPYYISTPNEWVDAKIKILMVGQEGHGEFGSGKSEAWNYNDIEKIQAYNHKYLHIQWNSIKDDREHHYNKSGFWKVFRDIKEKADESSTTVSCAWSNIDKIHRLGYGSNNCALLKNQREDLHSTHTKVLLEEIRILKPDFVVFLGTHYTSLKYALNDNGAIKNWAESEWSQNKHSILVKNFDYTIESGENKTTQLILRYFHPNAWKKYKGATYENDFLNYLFKN